MFCCTDIDECSIGKYICGDLEECENTDGNYTCNCQKGYRRDDYSSCIGKEFLIARSSKY